MGVSISQKSKSLPDGSRVGSREGGDEVSMIGLLEDNTGFDRQRDLTATCPCLEGEASLQVAATTASGPPPRRRHSVRGAAPQGARESSDYLQQTVDEVVVLFEGSQLE